MLTLAPLATANPSVQAICATPEALPLESVLALLIGGAYPTVAAEGILNEFPSLSLLGAAHPDEMTRVAYVGRAAALRIRAAYELALRIQEDQANTVRISSPCDVATLLMPRLAHREQEVFAVVLLNTRNAILDVQELYRGTLNSANVRLAEVFRSAIRRNAASLIIAHNHPSGDPTPSPDDCALTREIHAAGKMLGIELLDHLIIGGPQSFLSMKERGLGF